MEEPRGAGGDAARVLLLGIGLFFSPAMAAEGPSENASVAALLSDPSELVVWLREHNPDVKAAAARSGQARADVAQSRLRPNPALAFSLSDVALGETNPPGLAFRDTAIYLLSLSQTLEIGKRGPRIRSAELRLGAGREFYTDSLSDAMGRARLALGRVAYLNSRVAALEESLANSRQMLELQRVRFDHGDLSGNDYDRLLVDSVVLESDVAQSKADYEASLETCGAVLLARCDAGSANLDGLDSAAGIPPLEQGWDDRVSMRPDLRALELQERSAREDVTSARRRAIPDPSLNLGYNRDRLVISGDQPRTLSLGVSLALPLFDRGQVDAARAELRAEELRQTGASIRARARADAAGSLDRLRAVEHSVAELRARALPRSRGVLDSTQTAVGQGELSMTDLLLARRTHTELVLKVMELQWSAFSIRNDLRQALGLDAEVARSSEGVPWKRP